MSRLCKKNPSVCTDDPLSDSDICHKMVLLRQILASCFGPCGRLKQIHNNVGGHVLTTSTSAVLLKAVNVSHPLLKLITASILNHTSRFSDCGLFAAILCFGLIDNAKRLDLRTGVAIKVNKHLLQLCNSYLVGEDCCCKVYIDFSSCQSLITLAHSVITSKPACVLTVKEAQHISSLTVQAFLQTVPCDSPGRVRLGRTVTVAIEGQSVGHSAVFPGLLLDMPDMLHHQKLDPGPHRLVLFSASLAGDLSEAGEGTLEIHSGANPEAALLDQLLSLGEQMVRDGVGLFACQKVIHPVLQHYLRRRGVVVVERLGLALLEPIVHLTGAQAVATFHSPVSAQAFGQVGGLRVQQCGSREMLQLLPSGNPAVCTMVLCHRNETMLDELKVTCQRAEHVLRLTLREPYALLGGGCTETLLSCYIRHMSQRDVAEVVSALGCSGPEFLLGVEGFCRSLEAVALALEHDGADSLIDLSHAHRWAAPADAGARADAPESCGCGLMDSRPGLERTALRTGHPAFLPAPPAACSSQPRVLDSFPAKLSALNVAVETANLIMDVKYIIQDVN